MVTGHALPLPITPKNRPWSIFCVRTDVVIEAEMVALALFKWKLNFMEILTTV